MSIFKALQISIGCCICLLLLAIWLTQMTNRGYEYRTMILSDLEVWYIRLNEFGDKGWENYAVTRENGLHTFYLRRVK